MFLMFQLSFKKLVFSFRFLNLHTRLYVTVYNMFPTVTHLLDIIMGSLYFRKEKRNKNLRDLGTIFISIIRFRAIYFQCCDIQQLKGLEHKHVQCENMFCQKIYQNDPQVMLHHFTKRNSKIKGRSTFSQYTNLFSAQYFQT